MKQIVCVKIGGSAIDAAGMLAEFCHAIKILQSSGAFPVIIHGGGKDIGRQLALLKKKFSFVEGMRVTDAETMQTVQMVLSGDVNKRIVNELQNAGLRAVGISGVDAGLFKAQKLVLNNQDLGFVGTIASVDTTIIDICNKHGLVAAVSPVSRADDGQFYNVNADVAASELAQALRADHLVFVSDVNGVLIDGKVAHEIRIGDIEHLAEKQYVTGGMLPKLRSAAQAVQSGVGRVHICGWHGPQTLANEIDPSVASGTVIH
jgi:acetylglutamate kinase